MANQPNLKIKLVSLGSIIPRLHYGPEICDWWTTHGDKNLENGVLLFPIRVGWQTVLEINNKSFYTQVQEGNESHENRPGYLCKSGLKFSDIEEKPTPAIASLYKRIFPETNTNFSGPQILGWNDPELLEQSLVDIEFRPFLIKIGKYNIYVTALGEPDIMKAGIGYTAVLIGDYLGRVAKYIQRIDVNGFHIQIYQNDIIQQEFSGTSPDDVWKASRKFKKYNGTQLFGLEHPFTKKILEQQKKPKCDERFWGNSSIMSHLYNHYLRRQTISNIQWHQFFINWKESPSTIIEFSSFLAEIYPPEHVFNDRELRAWRAMLKAAGCHDVTPFKKDESKVNLN
jgi:hypothetical protein